MNHFDSMFHDVRAIEVKIRQQNIQEVLNLGNFFPGTRRSMLNKRDPEAQQSRFERCGRLRRSSMCLLAFQNRLKAKFQKECLPVLPVRFDPRRSARADPLASRPGFSARLMAFASNEKVSASSAEQAGSIAFAAARRWREATASFESDEFRHR